MITKTRTLTVCLLFTGLLHAGVITRDPSATKNIPVPEYTYLIVKSVPHDHQAYTQGLVFYNGFLYEGTGQYGHSSLRKLDPENGAILSIHSLAKEFFGEGITIFDNRIYQLTWQEYTGFVYDLESFLLIEQFFYNSEGWGITHDNAHLIISDGTAVLYFLDPYTYELLKKIDIRDDKGPVENLNELEFINGEIFANVLYSNRIARINPQNGRVIAWIDLTGILSGEKIDYRIDVMNGIAYDSKEDRLFVTGKLWPKVFEIRLIKKAN
jgi:glutamine cyclotransferase